MINVTKPYLPSKDLYKKYVDEIWERAWLTNSGPIYLQLEKELKLYFNNQFVSFCTNGTVAIQLALKALEIKGEVITTPFSYVATTNSILWENCTPVFADIREDDFCIDADRIEEKITEQTKAIMAVHVYGLPCDVEKIENIARKHKLKVIYDAAHAFGVKYKGTSLLNYGDVSTCSFHSTKLFHTIEGGATICKDKALAEKLALYKVFGHLGDDYYSIGINGKNSEFHAAMGLCILPHINEIIEKRKSLSSVYDEYLNFGKKLFKPRSKHSFEYNYSYYPVVFTSEEKLLEVKKYLLENQINTRRYFYPSLNTLSFLNYSKSTISEDISKRVLALPLYYDLEEVNVKKIAHFINQVI